jgi:hypothetical protein
MLKKYNQFINEDLEQVKQATAEQLIDAEANKTDPNQNQPMEQKPDKEIIKNYEQIIKNLETKKVDIVKRIKLIQQMLTQPGFNEQQKKSLIAEKDGLTKQIQEFDRKINSYKGDKIAEEEPIEQPKVTTQTPAPVAVPKETM